MSDLTVYFAIAVATAFIALYLKEIRPEYGLLVTLAGVCFVLWGIVPRLGLLIAEIQNLSVIEGVSGSYITPVLKIIGVSYIAEFTSDICTDAGESALATQAEVIGKVSVAFIAFPIVEDVFALIIELLG